MKFLRVPCQSRQEPGFFLPPPPVPLQSGKIPPHTSVTVTEVTGSPVCVPGLLSQAPLKCRAQN